MGIQGTLTRCGAVACALLGLSLPALSQVQYVNGVRNAEDLVVLQNTEWVVASSLPTPGSGTSGQLLLINAKTGQAESIYPDVAANKPNGMWGTKCKAPDPKKFDAHGIGLRANALQHYELFVVNHGGRQAIELFTIDASKGKPVISWRGCLMVPGKANPNDVVAVPGGGLAFTVFNEFDQNDLLDRFEKGRQTGYAMEWQPGKGFSRIPGSELSGANGIEIDPEGRFYFISAWGSSEVLRLSRGTANIDRSLVSTGMRSDNMSWTWYGKLLITGQDQPVKELFTCFLGKDVRCPTPFKVVELDPKTMAVTEVINESNADVYGGGTSARVVGSELWVGTFRYDKLARYPLK